MSMYIRVKRHEHFTPVRAGLAITPVQMETMSKQGKSISTSTLENFIYFNGDQTGDLPLDLRRGVDANDIWEAAQVSMAKIGKLHTERARKLHQMEVDRQQQGGV